MTPNFTCPMRIWIFLTWVNKWYLHWDSCLQHSFHPKLDHSATTLGEKDLQNNNMKLVSFNNYFVSFYTIATGIYSICILLFQVNVLYDANVPPCTISKIMSTLCEDDKGTFLPKTIFNITEKARAYWIWQMESCNQWLRLRKWFKSILINDIIHFVLFLFV